MTDLTRAEILAEELSAALKPIGLRVSNSTNNDIREIYGCVRDLSGNMSLNASQIDAIKNLGAFYSQEHSGQWLIPLKEPETTEPEPETNQEKFIESLSYMSTSGNRKDIEIWKLRAGGIMFNTVWGCAEIDAVRVVQVLSGHGYQIDNLWFCVSDKRLAGFLNNEKIKPVLLQERDAMIDLIGYLGRL